MAAYTTLRELVQAINDEREFEVTAMLDNDSVTFFSRTDDDRDLLELHPVEVQEQALELLGFTVERV